MFDYNDDLIVESVTNFYNSFTEAYNDYVVVRYKGEKYLATPTEYLIYKKTKTVDLLLRNKMEKSGIISMMTPCKIYKTNEVEVSWHVLYDTYIDCIDEGVTDTYTLAKMAHFIEFYAFHKTRSNDVLKVLKDSLSMHVDEKYDSDKMNRFIEACLKKEFGKEKLQECALEIMMDNHLQKYRFKISNFD